MESLEVNKVVGGVLAGALLVMVIGKIGDVAVHPTMLAENSFKIDTSAIASGAETKAAPVAAALEPIAPLLAAADAGAGAKLAKKNCGTCHTFDAGGKNKVGPNLNGIVGSKAAMAKGYKYSKAMKASGIVWDDAMLDKYLTKPKKLVPKTKMAFAGLKKQSQRDNVIAYLKEAAK